MVGEQCLKELLASRVYTKVIVVVRRKPGIQNPKMDTIITDFKDVESLKARIKADDVYCAMGTTIGKAGSQVAFKRVDFEIPLKIAELALWNGTSKFILVSSLGADASSSVFYSKVKGELENALKKLKYDSLLIFRPSILLGDRKEKRTGEAIGRLLAEKLSFIFAGPLKMYKGTPVDMLAQQMVKLATGTSKGVRIIENKEIFELAEK